MSNETTDDIPGVAPRSEVPELFPELITRKESRGVAGASIEVKAVKNKFESAALYQKSHLERLQRLRLQTQLDKESVVARQPRRESLTQRWDGVLHASKLKEYEQIAKSKTRRYDEVPVSGYVRRRIDEWEELFMQIAVSKEFIDATIKAGLARILAGRFSRIATDDSPGCGSSGSGRSWHERKPKAETLYCGSTHVYRVREMSTEAQDLLQNILGGENTAPRVLPCGIYGDHERKPPVTVAAVALKADDGEQYVAVSIVPVAGHEYDENAYGIKRVALFAPSSALSGSGAAGSGSNVSLFEITYDLVPKKGWDKWNKDVALREEKLEKTRLIKEGKLKQIDELNLEQDRDQRDDIFSNSGSNGENMLDKDDNNDNDDGYENDDNYGNDPDNAGANTYNGIRSSASIDALEELAVFEKEDLIDSEKYLIDDSSLDPLYKDWDDDSQNDSRDSENDRGDSTSARTTPKNKSEDVVTRDLPLIFTPADRHRATFWLRTTEAVETPVVEGPTAVTPAYADSEDNKREEEQQKKNTRLKIEQGTQSFALEDEAPQFVLPEANHRRIPQPARFDLDSVVSISSSANSLVLQCGSRRLQAVTATSTSSAMTPSSTSSSSSIGNDEAIVFSGTLRSLRSCKDTRTLVIRDRVFEWTRGAALSGWMYKWPMQSQYAGRRTKRFFLLRGNTIQYFKNDPSNPTSTSTSTSTTKPQASTPAARRQSTTGVLQSSTEKVVLPRPRTSSFIASAASTLSALISEVASKEDHDGDLDDDGLDGDADGENGPSVSLSLTPDSTVYKGWRYFTPCVTVTTPTDTLWMKTCKQSIVDEAAWMREITRSITLQKKKPLFQTKTSLECVWHHESPDFVCVAVDAAPLPQFSSSSPTDDDQESRRYAHTALYCLHTEHSAEEVAGSADNSSATVNHSPFATPRVNAVDGSNIVGGGVVPKVTMLYSVDVDARIAGEVIAPGDSDVEGDRRQLQLLAQNGSSNIGSELSTVKICGNHLVFGGSNGFVGLGMTADLNGKRVMYCLFPSALPKEEEDDSQPEDEDDLSSESDGDVDFKGDDDGDKPTQEANGPGASNRSPVPAQDTSRPMTPRRSSARVSDEELQSALDQLDVSEEATPKAASSRGYISRALIEAGISSGRTPVLRKFATAETGSGGVLRLRGHGYDTSITCMAAAQACGVFVAGDSGGGLSLWKITPGNAAAAPITLSTEDVSAAKAKALRTVAGSRFTEDSFAKLTLQSFVNVEDLGGRDAGRQNEQIKSVQFLPNEDFLVVSTDQRLLLIAIGEKPPRVASNKDEPNIDSDEIPPARDDDAPQSSDPHLILTPERPARPPVESSKIGTGRSSVASAVSDADIWTPRHRKQKQQSSATETDEHPIRRGRLYFASWMEMDRVPSGCRGIFSMAVEEVSEHIPSPRPNTYSSAASPLTTPGSEVGGSSRRASDAGVRQQPIDPIDRLPDAPQEREKVDEELVLSKEQQNQQQQDYQDHDRDDDYETTTVARQRSITLWKLVVEREEHVGQPQESYLTTQMRRLWSGGSNSNIAASGAAAGVTQTADVQTNTQTRETAASERTPGAGAAAGGGGGASATKVVDADYRIYRFDWTDAMFQTALKRLKSVPDEALRRYLSKFY